MIRKLNKQYSYGEDIAYKEVETEYSKEGITIFEMKKPEATLEDAFMKIIGEGGNK